MTIPVQFFSYFKDLAQCAETEIEVAEGATVQELLDKLLLKFPKVEGMKNSMLVAVGLEYQLRDYVLKPSDRVSLFPPVQGG